jgi:hypothetical protein
MIGYWRTWFKVWCGYNAFLGLLMVVAAWTPLEMPLRLLTDILYWPLDGLPVLGRETKLMAGIGGAVLVGWCIAMHALVLGSGQTPDPAAVRACKLGLTIWLVLDSWQSAVNGAPLNVALNLVLYAGFMLPLTLGMAGSDTQQSVAVAERA